MDPDASATYVTVSDARFFLGTVALVNSLRLTGHAGDILVIDAGLTGDQARMLSPECDLHAVSSEADILPIFIKPAVVCTFELAGILLLIDSDIIITGDLRPILNNAAAGRICLFADRAYRRRFAEWSSILGLNGELRDEPYTNAGFIALRGDLWQSLLCRWHECCEKISAERSQRPYFLGGHDGSPFAYSEQDVLHAILTSEIPADQVELMDIKLAASPDHERSTHIVDRQTLRCVNGSDETILLHYWGQPKPWAPGARRSLRFDAYVDLLARLLVGDDLAIRPNRKHVPFWLRDDAAGRFVRRAPRMARNSVATAISALPEPVERSARHVARRIADRGRGG